MSQRGFSLCLNLKFVNKYPLKQIIHTKSTMCRVGERKKGTVMCRERDLCEEDQKMQGGSQLRPPLGVWRVGQVIRRNYLMFLLAWPSNQSMHGNNLPWRNARNHFTKRWTGRKSLDLMGAADLGVYGPSSRRARRRQPKEKPFGSFTLTPTLQAQGQAATWQTLHELSQSFYMLRATAFV